MGDKRRIIPVKDRQDKQDKRQKKLSPVLLLCFMLFFQGSLPAMAYGENITGTASPAEVYLVLAPLTKEVFPEDTIAIQATFVNITGRDLNWRMRKTLPCTVTGPDGIQLSTHLTAREPVREKASLYPGESWQQVYLLSLSGAMPGLSSAMTRANLSGHLLIRAEHAANSVQLALTQKAPAPALPPETTVAAQQEQYIIDHFSTYKPTYFLFSLDPLDIKFQLSAKYRIVDPDSYGAIPFLSDIYAAYTQRTIIDLSKNSNPFKDTSYMPAFFYYTPSLFDIEPDSWITRLGLETGYEHESNGKVKPDSRALEMLYVQPQIVFGDEDDYHLTIAPKVYDYFFGLTDNPYIHRYRGNVDLEVEWGQVNGLMLSALARKGTNANATTIQLDATYPILSWEGNTYLHLQFFDGYGDTVLEYDKRNTYFRIGFSLIR